MSESKPQESKPSARMTGYEPSYAAEQACIAIYLGLHVSQLNQVSEQVRTAWFEGQRLYSERSGA